MREDRVEIPMTAFGEIVCEHHAIRVALGILGGDGSAHAHHPSRSTPTRRGWYSGGLSMLPPGDPNPPTVRTLFETAFRALVRRPDLHLHLGLVAVVGLIGVVSCCCTSGVAVLVAFESATYDPDATGPVDVLAWAYLGTYTILVSALSRGFTIAVIFEAVLGRSIRFRDAIRAVGDRYPAQLGVELVRVALENVPLGLVFVPVVLRGSAGPSVVGGAFSDPFFVPLAYASVAIVYVAWSSPIRTWLGPLPAVAQAESGRLGATLRRSRSLVSRRRGAYLRMRLAFGAFACAVLGATLVPWIVDVASMPRSDPTTDASLIASFSVVAGMLLFYIFGYALFLLDAALDAAFYVHVHVPTQPGRTHLAEVFA